MGWGRRSRNRPPANRKTFEKEIDMSRPGRVLGFLCALILPALVSLAASGYEAGAVSDAGTISGRVRYLGAVAMKKIVPTKDMSTCGKIREEPQIMLGADKGVQDAVVYLKNLKKGKAWT